MKVILTQDVQKIGKAGDIKEVSDGFARNFLLSKKLAVVATPETLAQASIILEQKAKKAEAELEKIEHLAEHLEGFELEISAKADEEGNLYGSISANKISQSLKENGFDVDKKFIDLKEPIKEAGDYEVLLNLPHGLEVNITVIVKNEDAA